MALRETDWNRERERESWRGECIEVVDAEEMAQKELLSRVLKVNRDERREMQDGRGCSCRELLVGRGWKMGDCSDSRLRAVRLRWKIHLEMDVSHHSPQVIHIKWKVIITLLQKMLITLQPPYLCNHLCSLATKQQAKTLSVIVSLLL